MNSIHSINGDKVVGLIAGHPQKKYAWLQGTWLTILFLSGLYLWGYFLNWGRGPVDFHDWAYISAPRLTYLREALIRRELPLHISTPAIDDNVTDRFLAIPDQILSPQILLLPQMTVSRFVLMQYWLMYALGFWALLLLRRRFELSLLVFTILFALFNFNGHILAHASVGHATWGGYFLYAGFAVLIFDLLEGQANWRWVAKVVFLALFIFLQGSYHQFLYVLFFMGLLALSAPRYFWWLAATSAFAVLVAMLRVLPASLLIGQFESEFRAGYPLGQSIWRYLTQIEYPNNLTISAGQTKSIGSWEFAFFIGIPAALFILYFGVVRTLIDRDSLPQFKVLLLPCLGLAFLSIDKVYSTLRTVLSIPVFTSERVAARIFSLAFVFLLILAAVQFQRWLDKKRPALVSSLVMVLLAAMFGMDLLANLQFWSIPTVLSYYPEKKFEPSLYVPANRYDDTQYLTLLVVGLLVSLVSAAGLFFLAWREQRASTLTSRNEGLHS